MVSRSVLALVATALFLTLAQSAAASYGSTVLTDTPLAFWRLDESPGASTAVDGTGHGFAGAYTAVTLGVDGAVPDADAAAQFSRVAGSVLNIPNAAALNFGTGGFTVEAWINTYESGEVIAAKAVGSHVCSNGSDYSYGLAGLGGDGERGHCNPWPG